MSAKSPTDLLFQAQIALRQSDQTIDLLVSIIDRVSRENRLDTSGEEWAKESLARLIAQRVKAIDEISEYLKT